MTSLISVFALLPQLPGEDDKGRCDRSLALARKTGEVFDVAAGTYEVLLWRALRARLDSSLLPSDDDLWLSPGYELYSESVYSATACAEVCSVLRAAAGGMVGLADDCHVFIDENGEVVRCRGISDEVVMQPLSPSKAARECLRVADGLEKVVASAQRQGAAVAFNNS